MSSDGENPFKRKDTTTRLNALNEKGFVIVVTRAYGPNGEDLIDHDGPRFSGEPGVKIHVKQGDLEEDIVLSPYFSDHSKIATQPFKEGVRCELTVPGTGQKLDELPIKTQDGSRYFAIYLSPKLADGELVAVNDVWGNFSSRILGEADILELYADNGGEG